MLTKKELYKKYERALYIKNPEYDEEKHACMICMQPMKYPKACQKCAMIVCPRCSSEWLKVNNRCPKKCSEKQWQLKNLPTMNFIYSCPYGCDSVLADNQFQDHLLTCVHSPHDLKNLRTKQELKLQYLCQEGHSLAFLNNKGFATAKQICGDCEKSAIIRSKCNTCKQGYCSQCRPPLGLTNLHCPQGHKFLFEEKELAYITCDHCSKKVLKAGKCCYCDPICNYAVCKNCYETLPKQQPERY